MRVFLGAGLFFVGLAGCLGTRENAQPLQDTVPAPSVLQREDRGWESTPGSLLPSLEEEGWSDEDRRVVGNLHALTIAFNQTSKWAPSPASIDLFEQTPAFKAINLWNPFLDEPGTLLLGPPIDKERMALGSYSSWAEGKKRYFAGGIQSGVVVVEAEQHADGWGNAETEGYESADSNEWTQPLATCRLMSKVALLTTPQLTKADKGPARSLDELKTYWWLWDHAAVLERASFREESLSVHWLGKDLFGMVDCLVDGESVWQHSPLQGDSILADMATLPPLDWVRDP
ncbi:hypothetical protein H8D30_05530 [bacterium]|nr:hypothetical protein [bacterium]